MHVRCVGMELLLLRDLLRSGMLHVPSSALTPKFAVVSSPLWESGCTITYLWTSTCWKVLAPKKAT